MNYRFLDLALRMPDELRTLEPAVREAIAAQLSRGKVECRMAVGRAPGEATTRLNAVALTQLGALAHQVAVAIPSAAPLGTADILSWPGVVDNPRLFLRFALL